MANAYTQDIILDADGKPVLDALTLVRTFMADIQKAITGIGVTSVEDAKKWQQQLALNLKMLKQAESDLKTLQNDRQQRQSGFAAAEKAAKDTARAEVQADKEANRQKVIEAKVTYGEKQRAARGEADVEKQLAREIADFEKSQDRAAIASAKEVAAARREAAQAAVTGASRGITNRDDALAAKAASDQRLNQLRRERETVAANDAEAARGIANRISVEKALGTALDGTIRKLNQQAEADRRAQEQAEARLRGQTVSSQRLLAPGNVRDQVQQSGDAKSTLVGYQFEQELARRQLQAQLASKTATLEEGAAARQRLEVANANVAAAERLVREEQKLVEIDQKLAATQRLEQQKAQVALSGQYAREQVNALGPKEALRRATEATALAEQRLATASAEHVASARLELELAKAQESAVKKQGQSSPLSNVLSPSYAVTAFARTAVYGAAAAAAYSAFNALEGGAEQVVQMEDELAKLQGIAGATDPQLQQIKASIYDIGSASRFSVIDLAKISQTLAQAGVTASDMKDVLGSVTTLATASGSTPDEAVNLVTSALGAFQLQASEAARVADLMTSALNRTKLTVQQTGQAIQYVGATAYEQNISLEQLLATVGAVAQAGIKSGSTIGTGFRQFLVDLSNPSEKLKTQLDALKLSAADVDVSVRGLPAVLDTLAKAGFGSGQAYAGLETRAAAFYLVAKNNVDIMDQLQLGFANSGAAATANERAMNSLTAQWQRFKNILAEGLDSSMEGTMTVLQNVLTALSDRIEQMRKSADDLREREANGTAAWYEKDLGTPLANGLKRGLNLIGNSGAYDPSNAINQLTSLGDDKYGGLGTWLESWSKSSDGATAASARLDTQVAETTDTVTKQTDKISELDKEMARLIVQKESLRGNDVRSAAEISTLTARFEGLAVYLVNTGNRYDDLTNAVNRYRQAQLALLDTDLTAQNSTLALQTADAAKRGGTAVRAIKDRPDLYNVLTPQEKAALDTLLSQPKGTPEAQRAQGVIGDALRYFSGGANQNSELSKMLNQVVQAVGTIAQNNTQMRVNDVRIADTRAAQTAEGRKITLDTGEVTALITRLGSATGGDKTKLATQGLGQVNALDKYINGLLANKTITGGNRKFLENSLADIPGLRQQITASTSPTKADARADATAERAADRAATLVSQSDIDKIGVAMGLGLGRGHDESARARAVEDSLHARGLTPATGDTSAHTAPGSLARDFSVRGMSDEEAERTATAMRARYRAAGINAQVQFETGKGKNQGTGRHIHVGVRKGTTRRSDNTDEVEDKYDAQLGQAQVALDENDLKLKLKDVARATTTETFNSAVTVARGALDKVNGELKGQAEKELAAAGFIKGDPQYDAKMLQVEQTVQQNIEDFNEKIADAIVKSTEAQIKAAQTAFDNAVQPSQRVLQIAQSQSSGLDAYSLRNKVPDYVKSLANDRIAQAQEGVSRSQYAALPAQISATQGAIDNAQAKLGDLTDPGAIATVNQQIAELNKQMIQLVTTRESLGAQLGAGGLIPTSFGDGLNQAIQAFRQANNLSETFGQSLTMNLGGALDTVNSSLTTMFTSILDGSQTALQAFGTFAKGVMQWMVQLAAKAVATQVFNLLLNVIGGGIGGKTASTADNVNFINSNAAAGITTAYEGGLIGDSESPYSARIQHYAGGGEVMNGSRAMDSVHAKLARGEFVMQNSAVDSVGTKFMAKLNDHGAQALDSLQKMPQLDMTNHVESNIYVVPPAQVPQLGPNDVKVVLNDELMNGDAKRLVEHISRSSR